MSDANEIRFRVTQPHEQALAALVGLQSSELQLREALEQLVIAVTEARNEYLCSPLSGEIAAILLCRQLSLALIPAMEVIKS